ncbi:hypothetical protein E2E30_19210 (plasmid) [Sphingomonas sp. AAP5]|uniref:hypothetical protein n=1 Tax=unclassified Sphingomonas TaxID=196159 RepID=UPI001057570D|nr:MULTISPECIES: hypothetical protein [unclassified Sphingomonas]MBB3588902.1 hypothetical protein [Sphingomonas sp. BK481]QBM78006.1 hypothetical protein E2E30_19210 [Sphingomonas sp. AAP5]
MGLDDRAYMRERYRKRQGFAPERTTWNDWKARRELQSGPTWFVNKNGGHRHRSGRWGSSSKRRALLGIGLGSLVLVAAATRMGAPFWLAEQFTGIILGQQHGFPASGTVSVPANIDMSRVVAKLTVQGGSENAIVQMIDAKTGRNTLSIYVRAHERVTVPAPIGGFHMRLVHGREWTDGRKLFGKGTLHEEVDGVMRFTRKVGHVLDLRLGHDSNLAVRRINLRPAPLA